MHVWRVRAPPGAVGDGGDSARRVRNASPRDRGSGNGNWVNARVPAASDQQRAASGYFDGDEVAARTASPEGRAVPAKTFCAGIESGGDEGAVEFSLPRETAPTGRPADAERHGRGRRVQADPRMVEANGDGGPGGAYIPSR